MRSRKTRARHKPQPCSWEGSGCEAKIEPTGMVMGKGSAVTRRPSPVTGARAYITASVSAKAMVVINAFSAWRESSRVCWTTMGTFDSITLA